MHDNPEARRAPRRARPRRLAAALLLAALPATPSVLATPAAADAPPPAAAAPPGPSAADVALPEGAGGANAGGAARAPRFMAATAHPLATEAARAAMAEGGGAVDAAIAAQLVLNLVEPQSSGLGGGAFLLHRDARSGELASLDGREAAPAAARPDRFLGPDGAPLPFAEAVPGGRSVGVPGTPRLLELAHERWGRLPWARLVEPAIRLAEAGFPVSPRLARSIAETPGLARFEGARAAFLDAAGLPLAEGATFRSPDLARTLRAFAEGGADAFYGGWIGEAVVAAVRDDPVAPGDLAPADLRGYAAKARDPVCAAYRARWRVCGMGPPSSGGIAVLQILGLLERFDMGAAGPTPEGFHLLLEAQKLAFADRNLYVADPDHAAVPTRGLLDPGYLGERARLIDPARAREAPAPAGEPPWREAAARGLAPDDADGPPGTSHLVAVDARGDVASLTTTIEAGFGSRLMAAGFLLNNELTDFAFAPTAEGGRAVANRVEGGKRPRSSMAPTIVLDAATGRPVLALGSPGGARIIAYVAKVLVAHLDWGLPLPDAIALGHAANLNGPMGELEEGTAVAGFRAALEAKGHKLRLAPQPSGVQAVAIGDGATPLLGAADPRREGAAAGG